VGSGTFFSYSVERRPTEPGETAVDAAAKRDEPAICSLYYSTPCRCQSQLAKITCFLECYDIMQWLWTENMAGKIGGGEGEEKEGQGDGGQEWFHRMVLRSELEGER